MLITQIFYAGFPLLHICLFVEDRNSEFIYCNIGIIYQGHTGLLGIGLEVRVELISELQEVLSFRPCSDQWVWSLLSVGLLVL